LPVLRGRLRRRDLMGYCCDRADRRHPLHPPHVEGLTTMIQSRSERVTSLVATGLLIFFAIVWLLPFVTIVLSATRSQGDLISRGVFSLPKSIRWENFIQAWNTGGFTDYFKNSLLLIIFKVPLGLLIASLAAYPLAKMRFG